MPILAADLPSEFQNLDFGNAVSQTSESLDAYTGASINADQLLALANNGDGGSIFSAASIPSSNSNSAIQTTKKKDIPVQGGTQAGVDRVNASDNSRKSDVTAYTDKNGRAYITNMDGPIDETQVAQNVNQAGVNVPTPVATFLNAIHNAKSYAEAQASYDAFTNAATISLSKLQKDALDFGNNKIGIPQLEAQLTQTQATDKASIGYYPGIGDSPVTQKVRAELNAARGIAQNEAQTFLSTNVSANLLKNTMSQAQNELKMWERKDLSATNRADAAAIAGDRRQEQRDYTEEQQAAAITPEMLNRAKIIDPQQFVNSTNPNLSAFRVMNSRKNNKDYAMAMEAPDSSLTTMAFMGNGYARTIKLYDEMAKTGRSEDAVKADMVKVDDLVKSVTLPAQWAAVAKLDPNQSKAALAELKQFELTPDKKDVVSARKVQMALDVVAAAKTNKFLNDLTSWDSIDLSLRTAIAGSQKTTGNTSFDNVLTSFVGDKTGIEAQQKLKEFQGLMLSAADKHKDSIFRMPDTSAANLKIGQWASRSNSFTKLFQQKFPTPLSNQGTVLTDMALFGPAGGAVRGWNENYIKPISSAFDEMFGSPVDPSTGKSFGAN